MLMTNSLWPRRRVPFRWVLLGVAVILPSQAVIFYETDDPAHHTAAPTGELADSGWQYVGQWGGFPGTAIAQRYFITAAHVGGTVGNPFIYRGVPYPTAAFHDDPNSDLRIWQVCGSFPDFATLYTNSTETGQRAVVIGRGTRRGDPVSVTDVLGTQLKAWKWGAADGVQRWGENAVAGVIDGNGIVPIVGGGAGTVGQLLEMTFDAGIGECTLSSGDSGGPVFLQDGVEWKLAGINFAVDGPYSTNSSGPGFMAAVFDEGGLHRAQGPQWVLTPDLPTPQPASCYATRISSNLAWINSVIATAPPLDLPTLFAASSVAGPYAEEAATVDPDTRTITVTLPASARFYRLRSCGSVRIADVVIAGGALRFTYE